MFKSLTVISLFTTAALAQGSSNLIPSGISEGCSNFLNQLNADKSFTDYTAPLIKATAPYAPNGSAAKNSSSEKVVSALNNLCSAPAEDTSSLVGSKIAGFYSACTAELTSNPNKDVCRIYDTVYVIPPLKEALCAKDDGGNYCSTQAKPTTSNDQFAQIQKVLALPSENGAALVPNTTTFHTTNLPFLFLLPSLSSGDLCNPCTRKILNAYLTFQAKVPYAPGLGKSILLSSQPELYKGIQDTCGADFMNDGDLLKAAGNLGGGPLSKSGAAQNIVGGPQGFVAAGMGALAFVLSSMF